MSVYNGPCSKCGLDVEAPPDPDTGAWTCQGCKDLEPDERLSDAYFQQQGDWYKAMNEVYCHTRRIWREACGLPTGDAATMRQLADQLGAIRPESSRIAEQMKGEQA